MTPGGCSPRRRPGRSGWSPTGPRTANTRPRGARGAAAVGLRPPALPAARPGPPRGQPPRGPAYPPPHRPRARPGLSTPRHRGPAAGPGPNAATGARRPRPRGRATPGTGARPIRPRPVQSRRARRLSKGPSLIVVPRSLVFNWKAEAEKFCPRLRVLDYTGPNRHATRDEFPNYDLIITTYGTLRTDIVELSQITFDYVILDEAQAIKNADSQAAKAARLLKGRHRLAMSGTPIENHLGELWSIFEFLNPGMLGTASVFKKHASGASAADEGARSLLARALRPFILRRTKAQVVKDLPEKFEQTLICDLEPAQRQIYEGLKAHYRQALLRKDTAELGRSKIEVLEALLRLRQAACHPGLIDPERSGDPSAKLDMLIPQLVEVAEEGHKILVFSQFTKFLGLVRDRLDAEGLKYEYLDGRTRNRDERVERFQTDPDIPLFLISLKAGGLGLNLTAAGYVYLLDPWWNPAVEAQAIDRSHRIGQTQQVFAYRLICRDTVEQKILELQQKKRDLADAILNENRNVIGTLTKDDLEFLLS